MQPQNTATYRHTVRETNVDMPSVYVSSAGLSGDSLRYKMKRAAEAGIEAIELSGGVYESDLARTISYGLNDLGLRLRLHNYFPAPKKPFVINLASPDDETRDRSYKLASQALDLSSEVGAVRYGVHAGFFTQLLVSDLGTAISSSKLVPRRAALARFLEGFTTLSNRGLSLGVKLYVENNVLTADNFERFSGQSPMMMSTADDVGEMLDLSPVPVPILLDLAHLQVSSHSLGLNFMEQARRLVPLTDYIHISDCDGRTDGNRPLTKDSPTLLALKQFVKTDTSVTVEVYDDITQVVASRDLVQEIVQ